MVSLSTVYPKRRGNSPRFEILGVFGSGKTTLTDGIAAAGARGLYEDHERNPFWGQSAELETAGYLPYDLAFLVHHAFLAARHVSIGDGRCGISDWSFITDRLWASVRLGKSLDEYVGVWREVSSQAGAPTGYIYLEVEPALIIERMIARGRAPEAGLYPFIDTAAKQLEHVVATLPAQKVLRLDGAHQAERLVELFVAWAATNFDIGLGDKGGTP